MLLIALSLEHLLEVTMGSCQAPRNAQSKAWKEWKIKDKGAKLKLFLHVEDREADAIRKTHYRSRDVDKTQRVV